MTSTSAHTVASCCRNCTAYCPVLVTVEDGRAVKVVGDPDAPAYDGYTCPKGRDLPAQHDGPHHLLQCQQRQPDGGHAPIGAAKLLDAVAARLRAIVALHGRRAVAVYYGSGNVTHPAGSAMARSWMTALGSELIFSAMAIDKPAANISIALHGHWHAGAQGFETSDTRLLVGANPVPGEDPTLLAGLIQILLAEGLHDADFVRQNADGLEAWRAAVAPFTPAYVAQRAGVPQADLRAAVRIFGQARRGGVVCAAGASFSTHGNLTFCLGL